MTSPTPRHAPAGASVVVIDGDPDTRRVTARLLAHGGYVAFPFATLDDALPLLRERSDVSVVLLTAPRRNSRLLVHHLARIRSHTLASVIVTGLDTPDEFGWPLPFRVLERPHGRDELLAAVAAALAEDATGTGSLANATADDVAHAVLAFCERGPAPRQWILKALLRDAGLVWTPRMVDELLTELRRRDELRLVPWTDRRHAYAITPSGSARLRASGTTERAGNAAPHP